jgi:anaerobic magnesium-protoporphyrin IX monomethyl ester cyclase
VRSTSLITARGCPYTCTWCSHSVFGHTTAAAGRRKLPTKCLSGERYRPDQLWYADDVLTIAPRWFKRYAAELQGARAAHPFECISRADRLNEEIVDPWRRWAAPACGLAPKAARSASSTR